MYLLHQPVHEYWARWQAFDDAARALQLTPADRHIAWAEHTGDDDWKWWPVPIQHFGRDPYYVGTGGNLRPAIDEFTSDFMDPSAGHEMFVFVGGLGSGKSYSAAYLFQYTLYVLGSLKRPMKYLSGFPGVDMDPRTEIALMNASAAGADQAKAIIYSDVLSRIQNSPFFQLNFQPFDNKESELEFPNRIRFAPGNSMARKALGWNMFCWAVDEAAFGIVTKQSQGQTTTDYVKELVRQLNRRRKSRFANLGWGGLFTSPGSEGGYVEIVAGDGEDWDVTTFVRRISTWEAKQQLVPGVRVFLLDRDPDSIRVLEKDLTYLGVDEHGLAICRDDDGNEVRIRNAPRDVAVPVLSP